MGVLCTNTYATPPVSGPFGLPYNENQTWSGCSVVGWVPYGDPNAHQYHMQYYDKPEKYHMGEDWNGKCSDEGAPLLALADGEVSFVDSVGTVSGQGKRLYIRYSFPYVFAPNGVMTFDSVYLHLKSIPTGITKGLQVVKGKTIAYLGNTGTTDAHLHWEAQTDLTLLKGINPYQNPLSKTHALRYRAPSLIVDDRRDVIIPVATADTNWHEFTMSGNAPSSIMYVYKGGLRKTLKNAIATGWVPTQGVLHESGGIWYYYNDVDNNFFENGKRYRVKAQVSGVTYYILVPRNKFRQDRARLDILHAVENDARFTNVKTETYVYNQFWDLNYELHKMDFQLATGGATQVYSAVDKKNPLLRYTMFMDPSTAQFTSWKAVNRNRLY
jgi:hypothetical protein